MIQVWLSGWWILNSSFLKLSILNYFFLREHDLRVVRPLVYVREKALRQFATNENIPVAVNSCKTHAIYERQRMKQLLTQQEILFPKLFDSLRNALQPLIGKLLFVPGEVTFHSFSPFYINN